MGILYLTFIADDTIDESCGVAVVLKMEGRGDEKVMELNDEKEVEARLVGLLGLVDLLCVNCDLLV